MASTKKASNARVIGLAVAGAVGGFLFGFDSSVVNGAVNPIEAQFHLSSTITGLAVASALIGCAIGAILGGRIGDRYGRIPTMVVAAILFFISAHRRGLRRATCGCSSCGGWSAASGSVSHRSSRPPTSPRSRPRRCADASARCSSSRSPSVSSRPCSPTRSSPTRPAMRAQSSGSASRPGDGCSSPASSLPRCTASSALTLPESPRFHVLKGEDDEGRGADQRPSGPTRMSRPPCVT